MILEYHRPTDLNQALQLLSRPAPLTIPLGGGTVISTKHEGDVAVVDLQLLGMDRIEATGSSIQIGARVTLEQLLQQAAIPDAIKEAVQLEATLNCRNVATIAGTIVSGDGNSPLLTVLLALDTRMTWLPGEISQTIGDYLPLRKGEGTGKIISKVQFASQAQIRFGAVGRTPMDQPIFSIAVSRWPSGRTRVCLGGKSPAPILVMDGTEAGGIDEALNSACSQIINPRTSLDYLKSTTQTLAHRLINA